MKRIISLIIIFIILVLCAEFKKTTLFLELKNSGIVIEKFEEKSSQEIVTTTSDFSDVSKALNLCIYSDYVLSDRRVIEGYSNKLNSYIVIDGKKVNIQLSIYDDLIVVGYPLIFNSF